LKSGDFSALKGESGVLLEFSYDNMTVGKYTEENYVNKKVKEYNEKQKGRGDEWLGKWTGARAEMYEPNFEKLFNDHIAKKGKVALKGGRTRSDSRYVLVVHTTDTEPGYNVGVSRMPGYITMTITLYEVSDRSTVI